MAYTSKTDDELKTLAFDIEAGNVFTNLHIDENDLDASTLRSIFMPLASMSQSQVDDLHKDEIDLFYEHVSKAEQRSVNGYPIFMSVRMLNNTDLMRLKEFHDKLKDALHTYKEDSNA